MWTDGCSWESLWELVLLSCKADFHCCVPSKNSQGFLIIYATQFLPIKHSCDSFCVLMPTERHANILMVCGLRSLPWARTCAPAGLGSNFPLGLNFHDPSSVSLPPLFVQLLKKKNTEVLAPHVIKKYCFLHCCIQLGRRDGFKLLSVHSEKCLCLLLYCTVASVFVTLTHMNQCGGIHPWLTYI